MNRERLLEILSNSHLIVNTKAAEPYPTSNHICPYDEPVYIVPDFNFETSKYRFIFGHRGLWIEEHRVIDSSEGGEMSSEEFYIGILCALADIVW